MRALAISGALLLTGCASTPPTASTITLQADTTLDAAYNVAASAYLSAPPAQRAPYKASADKAYALVKAADAGQLLAGETSLAQEIADADALITSLNAAFPSK